MTRLTILDGGTGTEIEKLLATLPPETRNNVKNDCWVGSMQLQYPDLVKQVHKTYIQHGADIVITNTYATTRHSLAPSGMEDRLPEAVETAVRLAKEAKIETGRPDVKIAGSVACHPPKAVRGADGILRGQFPSVEQQKKDFAEVHKILCENNVDMIFLELMRDIVRSPLVMEAVADSMAEMKQKTPDKKIPPVYICVSTKPRKDVNDFNETTICVQETKNNNWIPFNKNLVTEWAEIFSSRGVPLAGVNIMHTNFSIVTPTIDVIRQAFDGPIGVYPDHGVWKVPQWSFEEIKLDQAIKLVEEWVDRGVWMVGGCCGVGPDFIKAVADRKFEVKGPQPSNKV